MKAPADIVRSIVRSGTCPYCMRSDGLMHGIEKDKKGAIVREWATCLACNSTWDTAPGTVSRAR